MKTPKVDMPMDSPSKLENLTGMRFQDVHSIGFVLSAPLNLFLYLSLEKHRSFGKVDLRRFHCR